ncbi:OpgC domain-containing protein [Gordonia sp. VNK21]|uniref:OpgC domain-containing protein n=1 Tax=Gordonia sp. VNK21 TaxID=3382483 RepID=UPI0038D4B5BA
MGVTRPGRDLAIDATRGLAIWSMVSLHFADGRRIAAPTHAYPFVDGLSAFVLLSGLVLGIVYRRWTDRHGLGFAYRRLARRLVTLYAAQLFLSLVAVAVSTRLTARQFSMITVLPPDVSPGRQLWWALTLRWLPSGASILVVYLVLMASVIVLLPLLRRRGGAAAVLAGSVGLYAAVQLCGWQATVLHSHPGGGPIADWAAWQVLFVPALVIGWKWVDWRVPERVDAALPALLLLTALLWLALRPGRPLAQWLADDPSLTAKVTLGPARALAAWLVVTCVYAVFRRLLQWMRREWLRPLETVGARSLDAYVIQGVALMAVPTWIVFRPWGAVLSTVIALAVFGCCWAWAQARSRWGIDKLHRAPVLAAARIGSARRERKGETWRSSDRIGQRQKASASAP